MSAGRFFGKLKSGAQRLFGKIASDAPRILSKVSNTLGDAGTVVRKLENTGRDILGNPLVEAGAGAVLGPEASGAMMGASALLDKLGEGGRLAKQGSNLTNASTYKGGVQGVSQDILQRSTNIGNNAQALKQSFV